MANTSAILLALMVVATASVAHGLDLGVQVNITGDVKCSVAGKPDTLGVAGANVSVLCNNGQTTLVQGMTDTQGHIALNVTLSGSTTVSDLSQCMAKAVIPPRTCAVTLPTGSVEAKLDVKSVVVTPNVGVVIAGSFNITV